MQQIIIGLTTILLVTLLYLFTLKDQSTDYTTMVQAIPEAILHSQKTQPHTVQDKTQNLIKNISNNNEAISFYQLINIEETSFVSQNYKEVPPIAAIQLEASLQKLKNGDTLILPDIEGDDYILHIVDHDVNPNHSISATASFQDEGITYTTTITQSDKSTYITLSTPQGIYEIETKGNTGYIYKSSDIKKALQTSQESDVIIVPIPKGS